MSIAKKHIAVLAGGFSSEYSISIQSAKEILRTLDKNKYDALLVEISHQGWFVRSETGEQLPINKNDFSYQENGTPKYFDAVYNSIHGDPGENGKLQAYFELLNQAFTGCDSFCSSLTFNKYVCNSLLRNYGIAVADSIRLRKGDSLNEEDIILKLKLPCFVKPNSGGSSCGISRVNTTSQLIPAINVALNEDPEVIIESLLQGRELTCGLVKTGDEILVLPITEIVSKKEFFDYEAKYTTGAADEITPADIPESIATACGDLSKRIYQILGCRGLVRIDYILTDDQLWFLEVNTIPGMSKNSIVPQQIQAMGSTNTKVFNLILEEVLKD
ncbi:MAG: D-alanine--D-alanine ligase [Bacteroidales bacterium]|nr:D-alanine--D-alanine ligase [Bacteroidales bacterium]